MVTPNTLKLVEYLVNIVRSSIDCGSRPMCLAKIELSWFRRARPLFGHEVHIVDTSFKASKCAVDSAIGWDDMKTYDV